MTAARALAKSSSRAAVTRRRVLTETATYWTIEGLRCLATWLPERWLATAAVCIGDVVCFVICWRRRIAWARVTRVWPHLSYAQHRQLVRASYAHLAQALLWTLRLPRLVDRDNTDTLLRFVEIDEATRVQLACLIPDESNQKKRPRSAIVVSGHVGVWELLPALLGTSLLPRHTQWIVYRPLHNASINALVKELRCGKSRHLIADKNCFHRLEEALASDALQPSVVGLVADQRSSNPHTRCTVRFLGQDTLFSTGAARLHVATHSPLWFAALVVNEHSSASQKPLKLLLRPIELSDSENRSEEEHVQELTQAYADTLEKTVQAYASQYLWIHDLWSNRARQLVAA